MFFNFFNFFKENNSYDVTPSTQWPTQRVFEDRIREEMAYRKNQKVGHHSIGRIYIK
jgi:hypothetical protein